VSSQRCTAGISTTVLRVRKRWDRLLANDDLCAFLGEEEGRTAADSLCEREQRFFQTGDGMARMALFHTCAAPDGGRESLGQLSSKRSARGRCPNGTVTCDYGNVAI
jgi:hypothetical protein